jgi:AraC-like DNA-binding protein
VWRYGDHAFGRSTGGDIEVDALGAFGLTLSRPAGSSADTPWTIRAGPLRLAAAPETATGEIVALGLQRAATPGWLLHMSEAKELPTTSAVGRLIGNLITSATASPALDAGEAVAVVASALAVAEPAFRERPPGRSADPSPDVRRSAIQHIEDHLFDPGLSVEALAQALGLSRAALYRSFPTPGGITAHIRRRRLETAREALAARVGPRPTIAEIARAHGFASESHFSRAFRTAFGHAPGGARAPPGD